MKYATSIIAISLIVSVIMGLLLVLPKYQEFSGLKAQINQKRKQLENQQKHAEQLNAQNLQLKQKQELVSKVDSALPFGPDIPSLLEFLERTSTETGVSIERISWQEVSFSGQAERIKEHTLGLNFSGSYFAFKNFLSALERNARLIDVFQVSFSLPPNPEEPISFKLVMRIHSY